MVSDKRVKDEKLDELEKIQSTVRMTNDERDVLLERFGGIQAALDHVLDEAKEEKGWLPDIPRRLIPAFRALKEVAGLRDNHVLDSGVMRNVVMNACNCTRRTAVSHLHELRDRRLVYTFGAIGDEYFHFVVCTPEDYEKVNRMYIRGGGKK